MDERIKRSSCATECFDTERSENVTEKGKFPSLVQDQSSHRCRERSAIQKTWKKQIVSVMNVDFRSSFRTQMFFFNQVNGCNVVTSKSFTTGD